MHWLLPSLTAMSTAFTAVWLRDNALDPETRSTDNGQKLITLSEIPEEVSISSSDVKSSDTPSDTVVISFSPERKTVEYSGKWLLEHAYDKTLKAQKGWLPDNVQVWDGSFQKSTPVWKYDDLVNDKKAFKGWLW